MSGKADSNLNGPLPVVAPGGTISQNANPADPTHEREDSLSQSIDALILKWCHEDCQNACESGCLRLLTCGMRAHEMLSLFRKHTNSIAVAAYEAAKKVATNACNTLADCGRVEVAINKLSPESAILGAQISELEARLDQSKLLRAKVGDSESRLDIDVCIAELESQLSAARAKQQGMAKELPLTADHPNR